MRPALEAHGGVSPTVLAWGLAGPQLGFPGLLGGDLLRPWPHERTGPSVARVALERITLEHGAAAAHPDRLLRHRDRGAMHGDHCSARALDGLGRGVDARLRDRAVVEG